MPSLPRLYAINLLPAAALVAALSRWWMQGTGNLWSKASLHPYVPDPDLGFRQLEEGYPWLGLDSAGAIALVSFGAAAGTWALLRMERRRARKYRAARIALGTLASLPLIVPLWAFAGGLPAKPFSETRPADFVAVPASGIEGHLPRLPAGRYRVLEHRNSALVATLVAGGEAFDARFAEGLRGYWRGDPADLRQPMQASISVDARSVATGIDLRDEHARDELSVEAHPRVEFALSHLIDTKSEGEGALGFRALGSLLLMGRRHQVEVTGRLRRASAELRKRLQLPERPTLVLDAAFALELPETAIANDGTFDKDTVPIHGTVFLQHEPSVKKETP